MPKVSLRNYVTSQSSVPLVRTLLFRVQGARRQELAYIFWIVGLLVRLQDRAARERLSTQGTPEGPLARMHSTVVLHVVPEFERFPTELALERSIAGVGGQMGYQRANVGKRLPAELTEDDAVRRRQIEFHGRRWWLVGGIGRLMCCGWYSPTEMRLHQVEWFTNTERGAMVLLELAIFQRFQTVREDVAGELALMRKRRTTVHAGIQSR